MTPSSWKATRLADRYAPVCPQRVPMPVDGDAALLDVPRERLAQLRRFRPLLTNQSEDCLYLNLYVPRTGKSPRLTGLFTIEAEIWNGTGDEGC